MLYCADIQQYGWLSINTPLALPFSEKQIFLPNSITAMKALTLYLCVKSPQDGSFLPESTAKKLLKYEKVREKKL